MSKERPLILLDVDGPLADFSEGFLEMIWEETGVCLENDVITEFEITKAPFFHQLARDLGREVRELETAVWRRVNRIGFCSALEPIFGAVEAVKFLRTLGDVEVITSPLLTSSTWMSERFEWLNRHFGFRKDDVHFVSSKHRVPGDVLVDDRPEHLVAWEASCLRHGKICTPIIWDAPYNKGASTDLVRGFGWPGVSAILDRLHVAF